MNKIISSLSLLFLILCSCEEEKDKLEYSVTLHINPISNGVIVNSSPREVVNYFTRENSHELRVGWNEDLIAMRSFLTFDISPIAPNSNQEVIVHLTQLTLENSNESWRAFIHDPGRSILLSLVEYGELDTSDFDKEIIDTAAIISDEIDHRITGQGIKFEDKLQNYLNSLETSVDKLQLRIQITNDTNYTDKRYTYMKSSSWNFISKEEVLFIAARPRLLLYCELKKKE